MNTDVLKQYSIHVKFRQRLSQQKLREAELCSFTLDWDRIA